jgi:hypothetical protein
MASPSDPDPPSDFLLVTTSTDDVRLAEMFGVPESTSPKSQRESIQNGVLLDELVSMSTFSVFQADAEKKKETVPQCSSADQCNLPADSRGFWVQPVHIRPSSLELTGFTSNDGVQEKRPAWPSPLPDLLNMPIALRCDFCIKFDSVCSTCHFKWRSLLETKRKALLRALGGLSDSDRGALMAISVTRGTKEFTSALIELQPALVHRFVPFTLVPNDPLDPNPALQSAGDVQPFHLACAYDRSELGKLLIASGAKFQRTALRLSPSDLLVRPPLTNSVSDAWEKVLDDFPPYHEFLMVERAKQLRKESAWDDAIMEYSAILEQFPASEGAHCGLAKMAFDRGLFDECILRCDEMLSRKLTPKWVEFSLATVSDLRMKAVEQRHQFYHCQEGPALKPCGCIVTKSLLFPLKRLIPVMKIIASFSLGTDLYSIFKASRMPFLRQISERTASLHCDASIGTMLSGEYGYTEMYDAISSDHPTSASIARFEKFLGMQVVAMADFNTFIIRAESLVEPTFRRKDKDSWFTKAGQGQTKGKSELVVATKLFRVNRAAEGKAWDVQETGEWELPEDFEVLQ